MRDYQKLAERTSVTKDSKGVSYVHGRFGSPYSSELRENIRLLHAAMGISTEAGELMDVLKRSFFYGKGIDRKHIEEELGDVIWYVAEALNALGLDMEEVQRKNLLKLRVRFPHKFTEESALNRNLKKEDEVLGKGEPDHSERDE